MAPHTKTSTINSPVRPVLPGWPPPRSRSAGRPRHGPSRRSRWWWTAGTSSGPPGCIWRRQGPSSLHPVEVCPEPFLDRADQLRADLGLHRLPVPAGLASDRRDHLPELLQHFHLSHSFLLIDRGRGPPGIGYGVVGTLVSGPQVHPWPVCPVLCPVLCKVGTSKATELGDRAEEGG